MTLKEFFEQNGNKPIEIQEDGTIRVLEEKGPWKPEKGDHYYTVDLLATRWDADRTDYRRLELGNVFQTKSEAKRALHRLKARKKLLDAGGHEGLEGYIGGFKYIVSPCVDSEEVFVNPTQVVSAFEIWFESREDCLKAIDSLTKDEVAALCWTGDEE